VTAETLRRAPCAVAVAPRGWAGGSRGLTHIGVAVDGSERDFLPNAVARHLAAGVHPPANVRTIHVSSRLARDRVPAEVQLDGEVADALAAYSGRLDLLVVGSRGLGRIRSLILGSVGARLVAFARCPVLVLPATLTGPTAEAAAEVATGT
jgi:nucleotide-binding universal stress UspA family protein